MKPIRILIAGGSYAGLAAATNLLDLVESRPTRFSALLCPLDIQIPVEIVIVDERDGYYHLIGSPLALADSEYAANVWRKYEDVAGLQHKAIRHIHGSISTINCKAMTATIKCHGSHDVCDIVYDYFIAATGLRRQWPSVPQSLQLAEYLAETRRHIEQVKSAPHGVAIIGGGAVGVEMAAELKMAQPQTKVILIHSRDRLLSSEPLPVELSEKTLELLHEAGVAVVLGKRVSDVGEPAAGDHDFTLLSLSDGSEIRASHVVDAVSRPVPSTTYLPASTLDPERFVKIGPTLNFDSSTPNFRHHFAVGDLVAWSGIKRCGAAMHMGHFAANNIYQHILVSQDLVREPEYKSLSEHPPMIGIAVGHKAVSYSPTEGVKSGEDVLKYMFRHDLGWIICWDYMRLGDLPPAPAVPILNALQDRADGKVTVEVEEEPTSSMSQIPVTEWRTVEQAA